MKFGHTIVALHHPGWQEYYIDYAGLKQQIKMIVDREVHGRIIQAGEENELFRLRLRRNIDLVDGFFGDQCAALEDQAAAIKADLAVLLAASNGTAASAVTPGSPADADAPVAATEGDTLPMKVIVDFSQRPPKEVERLVAWADAIEAVRKFAQTNDTAVYKIIKKHDKKTGFTDRPATMAALAERAFSKPAKRIQALEGTYAALCGAVQDSVYADALGQLEAAALQRRRAKVQDDTLSVIMSVKKKRWKKARDTSLLKRFPWSPQTKTLAVTGVLLAVTLIVFLVCFYMVFSVFPHSYICYLLEFISGQ